MVGELLFMPAGAGNDVSVVDRIDDVERDGDYELVRVDTKEGCVLEERRGVNLHCTADFGVA